MNDTKLDKAKGVYSVQEKNNNVGVDSSEVIRGNIKHDVTIHHGPTYINVHVPNSFC